MILFAKIASIVVVALVFGLWIASEIIARNVEDRFPPVGRFFERDEGKVHFYESPTDSGDKMRPAAIFIHGASSNLNDQRTAFEDLLKQHIRLVFVDRPGHGYSESFRNSNDPVEQARQVADLMVHLDIERAVIVGHSFGGAVASAFAVLYPEKTSGLVLIAPVSHAWPTGVDWYYTLSDMPVIGWIFTRTLAIPAGYVRYNGALEHVFAPRPVPADYEEKSATRLVLRPKNFHENAKDVARLINHVEEFQVRYNEISAPVVIYTGEADDIVSNSIHAGGLEADIVQATRIDLAKVGHKPGFAFGPLIASTISELAR